MTEPYQIDLNPRFDFLELMDIPALAASYGDGWFNQTLSRVNDSVVRLGVVHGEFHWHKHDLEDEFFFVLEGQFIIELEDRTVTLNPHQGFTIPKGVLHCPRAPQRTVILMVEPHTVQPTGN